MTTGGAAEVVAELTTRTAALGWVQTLWVGGSLATGDHCPATSDLDLVALADGTLGPHRRREVARLHADLDLRFPGTRLGCAYVDASSLPDVSTRHPTWTHGRLIERWLSPVARAELVRHGRAARGPEPSSVLPAVSDDDVRAAVRAELDGYWTWALRRPWLWWETEHQDLALTTAARTIAARQTGALITKTEAVAALPGLAVPTRVVDGVRRRRAGEECPRRRLPSAWASYRLMRRVVAGLSPCGPA